MAEHVEIDASASAARALSQWRVRPLVLVGFMGSGKTSVGRLVAQRLGRECIDSDDVVESALGTPIVELFASGREREFRAAEHEAVIGLLARRPPAVLALGGGAFTDPATAREALRRGLVVHLELSLADLEAELPRLARGRPLLQNRPIDEIRALFREREALYARAHLRVAVGRTGAPSAARALLACLDDTRAGPAH